MIRTDSLTGRSVLCIAHCAGLVDLVALPLWVGALIQRYQLDPQQAGLLVTLFLAGGVIASLIVAPRFHHLASGRWLGAAGFAMAALTFHQLAHAPDFGTMAVLHGAGGMAIGAALSVTHGTVARSSNPHRLFALCGTAQGVFALVFLATMPQLMARQGAAIVFEVFAAVMALGALVALLAFPAPNPIAATPADPATVPVSPTAAHPALPSAAWAAMFGLCTMSLVQSMSFGFLERAGAERGFGTSAVAAMLAALGLINLLPTALAALLERRLQPRHVLIAGPLAQAAAVATIFTASHFMPYAVAGSLLVATILFTHVFGFGLLARLDRSGRALAATPAMMMTGAAIGPVLGGTLIKFLGYPSIGAAALALGTLAASACWQLPRNR